MVLGFMLRVSRSGSEGSMNFSDHMQLEEQFVYGLPCQVKSKHRFSPFTDAQVYHCDGIGCIRVFGLWSWWSYHRAMRESAPSGPIAMPNSRVQELLSAFRTARQTVYFVN